MFCVACHTRSEDPGPICPNCGADGWLEGRYRLEEEIAHGASATIYRARRVSDGRPVAAKAYRPGRPLDAAAVERWGREEAVLQQLNHPQIPDFLEALASGVGPARRRYLIMELVEGPTLKDELESKRYTEPEVEAILRDLAGVLAYLHGLRPPVVHRDVKPENVIRRASGELVLVDFGSVLDELPDESNQHTVAGTFGYMAPEQFEGTAFPASDVYALGALCLALLSREEPRVLLGPRAQPWAERIPLESHLKALLTRMLDEDPEARPRAQALAEGAREDRALEPARPKRTGPRPQAQLTLDAVLLPLRRWLAGPLAEPSDDLAYAIFDERAVSRRLRVEMERLTLRRLQTGYDVDRAGAKALLRDLSWGQQRKVFRDAFLAGGEEGTEAIRVAFAWHRGVVEDGAPGSLFGRLGYAIDVGLLDRFRPEAVRAERRKLRLERTRAGAQARYQRYMKKRIEERASPLPRLLREGSTRLQLGAGDGDRPVPPSPFG